VAGSSTLKHPVVVIAILIILGVFALIGAAILGADNGVLGKMADSNFARGLITYLFAVVTIGTAVVLVVAVLTSEATEVNMDKVDRGKDILSLLLGVFGTIVGFYFGSEIGQEATQDNSLNVTPLLLSVPQLRSNQELTITASVLEGEAPYLYRVAVGKDAEPGSSNFVDSNSWIVYTLQAPQVTENTIMPITVEVEDAAGTVITRVANLAVSP
jgi:hypothetical protein